MQSDMLVPFMGADDPNPRDRQRLRSRRQLRHARVRAAIAALLCRVGGLLSRRVLRRRIRGLLRQLRPAPHWSEVAR